MGMHCAPRNGLTLTTLMVSHTLMIRGVYLPCNLRILHLFTSFQTPNPKISLLNYALFEPPYFMKIDGWETPFLLGPGLVSGASCSFQGGYSKIHLGSNPSVASSGDRLVVRPRSERSRITTRTSTGKHLQCQHNRLEWPIKNIPSIQGVLPLCMKLA